MSNDIVTLTSEQRQLIDSVIIRHCEIRRWILHARNVRTNHVHVVVTADVDGLEVRAQLKAWCSRRLSEEAGFTGRTKDGHRRWFSERGDVEWIEDEDHLQNAIRYVNEMQ